MPTMKVGKTNKAEIGKLYALLNELEWLHQELKRHELADVDWENFELLARMGKVRDRGLDLEQERTAEYFLEDLVRTISGIHFQRILTNLEVMLDACADPDQDTLEYAPNIAKGLELLRAWVDAEPGRRIQFPVIAVAHAGLTRIGDSPHTSQCPECTAGTLVMRRDADSKLLLPEDSCLFCGQRFVYTDVKDGVIAIPQD